MGCGEMGEEIIPEWMLDCLNTIRHWMKASSVREIRITDEGIGWHTRTQEAGSGVSDEVG